MFLGPIVGRENTENFLCYRLLLEVEWRRMPLRAREMEES